MKLSEFLEIIEQNKGKHRQSIEVLVLGRRIGGMIRGGDTPTQERLVAIEFEAGKFAFGHANEDEIFLATRDGLAQIWYADANGVITGYTPTADNVASEIIDTYNEHFGTDINIWTPEEDEIIYSVGDEVYEWNSYIKISN